MRLTEFCDRTGASFNQEETRKILEMKVNEKNFRDAEEWADYMRSIFRENKRKGERNYGKKEQ